MASTSKAPSSTAATAIPTTSVLAARALTLLFKDPSWMVRRRESVKLLSDEVQRRTQVVEYRDPGLPVLQVAPSGQPVHWMPLFVLPKAPRLHRSFVLPLPR